MRFANQLHGQRGLFSATCIHILCAKIHDEFPPDMVCHYRHDYRTPFRTAVAWNARHRSAADSAAAVFSLVTELFAAHQDDHSAIGVLHACRRGRPHGGSRCDRPDWDQSARLVCDCNAHLDEHRPRGRTAVQAWSGTFGYGGSEAATRRRLCNSRTFSTMSSQVRSSRPWPTTKYCKSSCSRCFSGQLHPVWVQSQGLIDTIDEVAAVILRVTRYVMALAPLAIFAALAATVLSQGLNVLLVSAKYIGSFYLALILLWIFFVCALYFEYWRRHGRCCGRSVRRCCWLFRPPVPKRHIRKHWSVWKPSASARASPPSCCPWVIRSTFAVPRCTVLLGCCSSRKSSASILACINKS